MADFTGGDGVFDAEVYALRDIAERLLTMGTIIIMQVTTMDLELFVKR